MEQFTPYVVTVSQPSLCPFRSDRFVEATAALRLQILATEKSTEKNENDLMARSFELDEAKARVRLLEQEAVALREANDEKSVSLSATWSETFF